MSQKIIRLTEADLNRIVKKIISEQEIPWSSHPLITDQVKTIKPDQGGKYCFSRKKVNEIVSNNDRSYVVYKIKQGDTLDKIATLGNGLYNVLSSNDLCDLKNNLRASDVIIYSEAPSGDIGR